MGIRYNKAYNQKIRNIVKNFNAKVARAEAKGMKNIPDKISTKGLKDAYVVRSDLDRRLKQLENFTIEKTKNIYRVGSDYTRMTEWEYETMMRNRAATIRKVGAELKRQKQLDRMNKRIIASERTRQLKRTLKTLKTVPTVATAGQIKRMGTIIRRYNEGRAETDAQFYENFFDMLWSSVPYVDADEDMIQSIHDQLEQLTPAQLLELYHNEPLVQDIVMDYNKYMDTQGYAITDKEVMRKNIALENLYDALPHLVEKYSKR